MQFKILWQRGVLTLVVKIDVRIILALIMLLGQ